MDRSNLNPVEILEAWITGDRPKISAGELELLVVWELADRARSSSLAQPPQGRASLTHAFNITPDSAADVVRHKTDLLFSLLDQPYIFPQKSTIFLETLWNLWLPLAIQLSTEKQSFNRPLIQGILGSQGTGKTTLCQVLKVILGKMGYSTVSISLDDLYKTYTDRQQLQKADPRLIWRGPPGTHDLDLGISVLDKLRGSKTSELAAVDYPKIEIPRFDKSACGGAGDRSQPEIICGADIVLFEGWFVGVNPVADARLNDFLAAAPFPISTEADCQFARDMNVKLHDYLPLWNRLDRLIVLYPQDYRLSQVWRNQAEREMIAQGKSGMSEAEINRFVEYFWKALHPELFMKSMLEGDRVDLVIEILGDRTASKIRRAIDLKSSN